ncbi:Protein-L-isoaspartate(D-aspartate) O-methyltransferase [Rasamsonia emersonii CBS 393.64]|uniref:protein-L-isoaspartate(D-aspartate) O-methyltransferase n=1 Tax=Rasamsonia emersonii (strain ATCC 16479 / CBS 393.64 / IMI 116815) TaxID=1408163 RepID=A0A0F4Z5E1_RASE3|nr:Protein-L-isoaspartate(D-aspartate) O-methyltransferase [Rasamsonia emersonii CBS 393.64]KKA25744.1 Protein-L-isoaspartate(D-aspartate) O-methyltransferase [Rasamsonia emersonii CBS 393.64]
MAWFCSGSTNTELIENLYSSGLIKNERVKRAMLGITDGENLLFPTIDNSGVDRAHYSPSNPYSDSPQPIGYGATISAPHMHGHACEYLIDFLHPGSRVLDIGSGSGYLTHVFANLITDSSSPPSDADGHVIGIDHIQELVDLARNNMQKSADGRKFLESGKVKFVTGDGRLGWKEGGPYDVIHVGAAAETLHPTLVEQLRAPGRMFIPIESGNVDKALRAGGTGWSTAYLGRG